METTIVSELAQFLSGEPGVAVEKIEVSPAPPQTEPEIESAIGAEQTCDGQMLALLAHVNRVGMCAKDVHYLVKGQQFYGLHKLADLVWEVGNTTDDLIECYYMGARGIEPPRMAAVAQVACSIPVSYPGRDMNENLIGGLYLLCIDTVHLIERIKADNPKLLAGVSSVVDGLSQKLLVVIGLLDQTLKTNTGLENVVC